MIVKKVFKHASHFLPVTTSLKKQAELLLPHISATVVPNVVDTNVFCYKKTSRESNTFRFIHVSTMTYQKNPKGLLRSFKRFREANPGSCLWMVGPFSSEIINYAKSLNLPDNAVHFTGPVAYHDVAGLLQDSHALVLFSRYENLPCVVLEALCCGLPVISTRVGGIEEVVGSHNGVLLDNENEEQLFDAFGQVLANYQSYNAESISSTSRELYSYKQVGEAINKVYNAVLSLNKV
jgi:glycosyltransferase involved in cell wall biosynthesis